MRQSFKNTWRLGICGVRASAQQSSAKNPCAFALALALAGLLLGSAMSPALGASFGNQRFAYNVKVSSIYKGASGSVYVTFTPALLTDCNVNHGGYLTSTWSDAMGGNPPEPDAPKMQLALLLAAKAQDSTMEVRYRVNTSGTGWDKCAIDAIWLQ